MRWETANVHLGTKSSVKLILRHMNKQKGNWLHEASDAMLTMCVTIVRRGKGRATNSWGSGYAVLCRRCRRNARDGPLHRRQRNPKLTIIDQCPLRRARIA